MGVDLDRAVANNVNAAAWQQAAPESRRSAANREDRNRTKRRALLLRGIHQRMPHGSRDCEC
jgi:hypothetical protein